MKRPPEETPGLYEQDGKNLDAVVYAHYFVAGCDWFVTEYDPETDEVFGWARLYGDDWNAELGYTSLDELESATFPVRLVGLNGPDVTVSVPVEYDEHWQRVTLREAIDNLTKGE